MNRVTLEKLLNARVQAVQKSEEALQDLERFCNKNWGFTFHESDIHDGDGIVEWLDYGNASANVEQFIEYMDKCKTEEKESIS